MVSGLVVVLVAPQPAAAALLPDAPTLVQPGHHRVVDNGSPVIAGLAPAGTRVAVYIDDTFNGYATAGNTKNGVQSFKYTPFLSLTVGSHTVMTRAEDVANNVRSKKSRVTHFTVEPAYPSPTLLTPVVNEETTWQQPWIVGVAPSGATVEVWIDGILNGSAVASVDASGTGAFRYQPFVSLTSGSHTVKAVASTTRSDGTVRKSTKSEERVIRVTAPVVVEGSTVETVIDAVTEDAAADADVTEVTPVEPSDEASASKPTGDNTGASTDQQTPEASTPTNSNGGETISPAPENATPVNSSEGTTDEQGEGATSGEQAANSDSTSNDTDTAGSDDGSNSTRTVIGWILLVIAAAIIVVQMRQRRAAPTTGEMQFGPSKLADADKGKSAAPAQPTSPTASQQQLELHAPKENKNVQLVEKGEKKDSSPPTPTPTSSRQPGQPTQPNKQ